MLDVKDIPLTIDQPLANTPDAIKQQIIRGTGLSSALMPNTHHHFHLPVDGVVVHKELVETRSDHAIGTFCCFDWPNWVPLSGNVGRPETAFSQFQVASIPVGLDTVGSVVLNDDIAEGDTVVKGVTAFGNFYFGGSLISSCSPRAWCRRRCKPGWATRSPSSTSAKHRPRPGRQ